MQDYVLPVTILNVLEYDGLIEIESGVPRTTMRFRQSVASSKAARQAKREQRNLDLRECISQAMHSLHGKHLSEDEMQRLVDAVLPIASAEERQGRSFISVNVRPAARSKTKS